MTLEEAFLLKTETMTDSSESDDGSTTAAMGIVVAVLLTICLICIMMALWRNERGHHSRGSEPERPEAVELESRSRIDESGDAAERSGFIV